VSSPDSAYPGAGPTEPARAGRRGLSHRSRVRFSAVAVSAAALAAAVAVTLAATAGASTKRAGTAAAAGHSASYALTLQPMPAGTVTFGRGHHGRLTVSTSMFGLTPGSSHNVELFLPGRRSVRFSVLTAASSGQAYATLQSRFTGRVPRGSRLAILMGTQGSRIARTPIAVTGPLGNPGRRPHPLIAVEISTAGVSYGTPRGRATISYSASRRTLTVTVSASGVTPGPHAAHIHLGSCQSQGPVEYMLRDLVASRQGRITRAVRVFTNVATPVPATGWYLNIHQGNSGDILSNGQPTIYFRPLICANITTGAYSPILRPGDVVTGVRGTTRGNVVLTGGAATGSGTDNDPFLYQGPLSPAAAGAVVSVLKPPFPAITSATFYGPDTHTFNPSTIPAGWVRAVGSYVSSSAPAGVVNQGMIYLGPVSGRGGTWKTINVPADGSRTVGHVRACPRSRSGKCFVMDTIAHSTMGNLVVGNYDLNPGVRGGAISANAFIYNITRRLWTLVRLGGRTSDKTTLYGIWQDGGNSSPLYTLAGGSSARGGQRAFLMNYNERTGAFGRPRYYTYGNKPVLVTHFEGITGVPGGFNLVTGSSVQDSSMAFVPVSPRNGSFGSARWYPVNVMTSPLCPGGCKLVTGNSVYQNQVMGLYFPNGATLPGTYLATVSGR
jgi:CHRD domain-containing protein